MGIESFHPQARRAIRKGPDIERIIRAIERLKNVQPGRVGVSASFICGLPHEDVGSILKTQEWLKQNNHIINSANWHGLLINKQNSFSYASEIDLNPQKFGYTITNPNVDPMPWENEHMTHALSQRLMNYLNEDIAPYRIFSGWGTTTYSHFKHLDIPELVRTSTRYEDIDQRMLSDLRKIHMWEYYSHQLGGSNTDPQGIKTGPTKVGRNTSYAQS